MEPWIRRALAVVLACSALLATDLAVPPATTAADGDYVETAATTYVVDADAGQVDVTVDITLANHKASVTTYSPCVVPKLDPYGRLYYTSGSCPSTTRYYVAEDYLWVEAGATDIHVTASSGSVTASVDHTSGAYKELKLAFSRLYGGSSRVLHLRYAVPGGAPRSDEWSRIGQAVVSFCTIATGADGSTVTVKIPSRYGAVPTIEESAALHLTTTAGVDTFVDDSITAAASFFACFEGLDATKFTTTTLVPADGRPIAISAWPEDPLWGTETAGRVRMAVPALEGLVGRSLPGTGTIVVREEAGSELGAYAGFFDPDTSAVHLSENFDQPDVVAHELSHSWFNDQAFESNWAWEAFASWAGYEVAGPRCTDPGPPPDGQSLHLRTWVYADERSTAATLDAVDWEYGTACWIVTDVAQRIGPARTRDVLAAILDGTAPYRDGAFTPDPITGPLPDRTILDDLDEYGLVPAGEADLAMATDLFATFGVMSEPQTLAARTAARTRYHALAGEVATELPGWELPGAVLAPMGAWQFAAAEAAMDSVDSITADVVAADATLPGLHAATGPVRAAFREAASQRDLDTVAAEAADQHAAADAVAAADAALAAPRDPFVQVGLIGTDLATPRAAALTAARAADRAAAIVAADQVVGLLRDATGVGQLRIAIAVAVVVLVVVLIALAFAARGRRRARLRQASAPAVPEGSAPAVPEGSAPAVPEGSAPASSDPSDPT